MKKILSFALALTLCLGAALSMNVDTAYAAHPSEYKDISADDWFYPAAAYLVGKTYMTGYSDTQFAPNDTLSRAMFVTVLCRISGEKAEPASTFSDVPQDTWYSEAVAWAVANQITDGTGNGKFSPDSPVTRQEMAGFLNRYVDNCSVDMSRHVVVTCIPGDLSAASDWARDAVSFACQFGFLYGHDKFEYVLGLPYDVNPKGNATRANAAVAFYNLLRAYDTVPLLPYEATPGSETVTLRQETVGDPNKEFVYLALVSLCRYCAGAR